MIGDRWGLGKEQVTRHYACDDVAPDLGLQLWRGVTICTIPKTTWPWVNQMQRAPYSYDWIDNFG